MNPARLRRLRVHTQHIREFYDSRLNLTTPIHIMISMASILVHTIHTNAQLLYVCLETNKATGCITN